jgi:hypothetical protein
MGDKTMNKNDDFTPTGKINMAKVIANAMSGNPFQRVINDEIARISDGIDRSKEEVYRRYKQEAGNTKYEYGGRITRGR